jgi:hypothetical protein
MALLYEDLAYKIEQGNLCKSSIMRNTTCCHKKLFDNLIESNLIVFKFSETNIKTFLKLIRIKICR